VRPQAEVGPVAVRVEGQRLRALLEDVFDDLDLEFLAQLLEELQGLLAGHFLAHEGQVLAQLLVGGGLDLRQIFRSERLLAEKVVIEALLSVGPDGHLRAREEALYYAGDHVRRVVADEVEAFALLAGEDLERARALQRAAQVQLLVVELGEERRAREAGADLRLHELRHGSAFGHLFPGAVGQRDLQHGHLREPAVPPRPTSAVRGSPSLGGTRRRGASGASKSLQRPG